MKILLIYPYFLDPRVSEDDIRAIPIGLYYIGAVLKENNYDVEILDLHDEFKETKKLEIVLKEKSPHVIGFSIVNANRWGAIDISRTAKRLLPETKIVFGGIGATFLWEHLMKNFKEIDFIVLGEGEYSFLELLKCFETNNTERIKDIKGLVYRSGDGFIKTGEPEMIMDIDKLPIPSKYFIYQHVSSSRGCPSNCSFCGSPAFWGRKVRFHSPDYFVEQIRYLYEKGVSFFYVSDDTFTIRKERVIEICKKIIKSNLDIKWFAISRVNFVDEEILYWMRKAGCIQISYGVESGSEKIRKILNKDIKTEDIKKAFYLTKKYGILPRAYFIYGSPGENKKTIQETIDLIKVIKPLSIIFYILDIFPGTALYEDMKKRMKVNDDIWLKRIEDIMYFETDHELDVDDILFFGKILKNEFYKNLPEFVKSIELIERDDLCKEHAEFLSRLGMTFSHGDYSKIGQISNKEEIAKSLFLESLEYFPNERAYLGLGILSQKEKDYVRSIEILEEGLRYFPLSEHLNMCLGISFMNVGRFEDALRCFLKFQDSEQMLEYSIACYKFLQDSEGEALAEKRLRDIRGRKVS